VSDDFPDDAFGSGAASAGSGVDWLYQFTNNLTNLTTQNGAL